MSNIHNGNSPVVPNCCNHFHTGSKFYGHEAMPKDIWAALLGHEDLPMEQRDLSTVGDRALMKQIQRLLQRDPKDRTTAARLAVASIFQVREARQQAVKEV